MAEIQEIHGLIFETKCDILVNTVNCIGVMGAGIALECKYRYAGLFDLYEKRCVSGQLEPGKLLLFRDSKPQILCFPTKMDWKRPAKLLDIQSGLKKFATRYREKEISSIAFPQLGCSHGGLNWEDQVRPLMYECLEPLDDLVVEIYSLDSQASDSMYDELVENLRGLSRKDIASILDLRTQQVNRLMDAMDSGLICNMLTLQRSQGVGPKTTIKVYEYLQNCQRGESSDNQLGFGYAYEQAV